MTYLLEQSGTHFDPVCVEGWSRVCKQDVDKTYPLSNEVTFETSSIDVSNRRKIST
jgi:hypothetical protein